MPQRADAPQPIRVARAAPPAPAEDSPLADWVSPLTGQPMAQDARDAVAETTRRAAAKGAATLAERLAMTGDGEFGELAEAGQ